MTFDLTVKTSIRAARRRLSVLQRRQLPFAVSRSLNDVAFMARKRIVERVWPASFTARNKSFPKAVFRIEKSRKRPPPIMATPARLFDRLGRDYLKLQATGGTKRARGRNIAIPGRDLKRGPKGVRKGFRPRQAPDRGDTYKRGGFIFQRQSRGKVRLLYTLRPTARIDKRFRFFEEITKLGRQRFPAILARNLRNAIRTAR